LSALQPGRMKLGFAVLWVMLYHFVHGAEHHNHLLQAVFRFLHFGDWGVDLFFVLSGFLITGILFDAKGSANYSSSFYALMKAAEARGELRLHQGLARRVNVPDPGRWYVYDGRRLRADDGTELLYYHWGRMRHLNLRWPDAEEARRGFAFDRYGFYDPQLGPARLVVRRSLGRARELASQARRRLSDARASMRAAKRRAMPT